MALFDIITTALTQDEATAKIQAKRNEKLNVLYSGSVPFDFIEENADYARTNWMTHKKLKAIMGVTKFIRPIVLDKNYKIIDGQLRFKIAKELYSEGHLNEAVVPAIVFNVDEPQSTLLRILTNRMGEFPRWDFLGNDEIKDRPQDIPEFIDANPQLQPLLDSLGFWAQKILPREFFAETILDLEAPVEKPVYTPEIGLVKWAEIQTEINKQKVHEKTKNPLKAPGDYVSLFNLSPREADFVKTYAIEEEVHDYIHRMRDLAGIITDNYDIKRKAELGPDGVWQNVRRAPKEVIHDKKNELLEQSKEDFDNNLGESTEE